MRTEEKLRRALFGLVLLGNAALAGAQSWETYQGNAQHTGYVQIQVNVPNISQGWQIQMPGTSLSQVAAGGGMVFVTSQSSNSSSILSLFGIEAGSGVVDWTQSWSNLSSLTPPSLKNGLVYVQTIDNAENCLLDCYYANGDFRWRQPFASQWAHYLAPTVDSGTVYIAGGEYSGMYGFGASDGTHEWFCNQLMQYDGWTPSLDPTYAYVYTGPNTIGSAQAGLYAVNRQTGNLDFQVYDANNVWNGWTASCAVAVSNGFGYATNAKRLIGFDLNNRILAWQVQRQITGQPSVSGNSVYVPDGGGISAFDALTGAYLWTWVPAVGVVNGPIVLTNNLAFVTTASGTFGVDLTTHKQVWTTTLSGQLAIADGTLYIAGPTGQLTSFSLNSLSVVDPTAYNVVRGLGLSGSLSSLFSIDDQVLRVRQGPTLNTQEAPVQVVVTGTSPNPSPNVLTFHLQAFANTPGLTGAIELWNYSTGQWVKLSSAATTTTESVLEASAPTPAQFVQPGTNQVQARVSWKQTGPTLSYPWNVSIDQAVWLEG